MSMASETGKAPRKMPKGGRKGGATFPRYSLNDALKWSKKLVFKTHLGPQPQGVIHSGVVGAKNSVGNVRISALRHYGLLTGDAKGYVASELAKRTNAAPTDEAQALHREAVLSAKLFKELFNTFQGDSVTKQKLRQRAADLNVHPEQTDTCIDIYVSSMSTAGLLNAEGEKISHVSSAVEGTEGDEPLADPSDVEQPAEPHAENSEVQSADQDTELPQPRSSARSPRAVFNVNVTLDSSLDIEKLSKQLELLRRFGAI
jgi:hypothetical protein